MTSEVVKSLVAEGAALDSEIKAKRKRLEDIKGELCKLAPGTYAADNGRSVQIIQPSPTIKPKEEAIEAAREIIADESIFKKLFARITTWQPVKGFREVAAAVLSKTKAAKVIETCEVDSATYAIFG